MTAHTMGLFKLPSRAYRSLWVGNEPEGQGRTRQGTLSRASSADRAGGIEAWQSQ